MQFCKNDLNILNRAKKQNRIYISNVWFFLDYFSECFFAGKGTALVLALKDIPHTNNMERRLSTDSILSTNSTQSNSSDIQQHLQSMFYLLRNEETLKMVR